MLPSDSSTYQSIQRSRNDDDIRSSACLAEWKVETRGVINREGRIGYCGILVTLKLFVRGPSYFNSTMTAVTATALRGLF
jgi:hypothetical protein